MSNLFSTPKMRLPAQQTPPKDVSQKNLQSRQDELRKRLASMFGRQQTVLTGTLGETNRRTVLGA